MNRTEMQAVEDAYIAKFGEPIPGVPYDFGRKTLDLEWFYGHAQAAIKAGRPLDWAAILPPLPDGAVS